MNVQEKRGCKKSLFDDCVCLWTVTVRGSDRPEELRGGEAPAPQNLVSTFPQTHPAFRWKNVWGSLTSTATPSHKSTIFMGHILAPGYHVSHPWTLKTPRLLRSFLGRGNCVEYVWKVGRAWLSCREPFIEISTARRAYSRVPVRVPLECTELLCPRLQSSLDTGFLSTHSGPLRAVPGDGGQCCPHAVFPHGLKSSQGSVLEELLLRIWARSGSLWNTVKGLIDVGSYKLMPSWVSFLDPTQWPVSEQTPGHAYPDVEFLCLLLPEEDMAGTEAPAIQSGRNWLCHGHGTLGLSEVGCSQVCLFM